MDFEGRNPLDCDYDGIKQLLLQMFLNGKVNLNELTELIISQNTIGSVLSQCLDEPAVPEAKAGKEDEADKEGDEEDSDDEDDNMIFGVTSVVNLSNPGKKDCVKQLCSYFIEKCEDKDVAGRLKTILEDTTKPTGFIINERFINIPAQIAIPMLENLQKEIKRALDKKMPYDFSQYLMVIKFHRSEKSDKGQNKKKKPNKPTVVHYSNPEEEVFDKDLMLSYEFSVASDADTGLTGNWLEGDTALTPFRRVIVFESKNLSKMIEQIKELVQ